MSCAGYRLWCIGCLLGWNSSGLLLLYFMKNELWGGKLGGCYFATHNNIQDRVRYSCDPAWFHTIHALPKVIMNVCQLICILPKNFQSHLFFTSPQNLDKPISHEAQGVEIFLCEQHIRSKVSAFYKWHHLCFMPNKECLLKRLLDILPEDEILIGVWVSMAVDEDDVVWVYVGEGGGALGFVNCAEPLCVVVKCVCL